MGAARHGAKTVGGGDGQRRQIAKIAEGMGDFNDGKYAGGDFSGLEFTQKGFKRCDLQGARMTEAEFTQCDFKKADLGGADLTGAKFSQCEFHGARLAGARIHGAEFSQCEFKGADFTGADVQQTEFSQCDDVEGLPPEVRYREMSDMEDREKLPYARQRLAALAPSFPGALRELPDDEEIHWETALEGRPARLVVDWDWGSVELQTQLSNRLGVVTLHFDPKRKPAAAAPAASAWSEADPREQTHHLSLSVFLEEYPNELQAMRSVLERLPAGLPQRVADFMEQYRIQQLEVDAAVLTVRFKRNLLKLDLGKALPPTCAIVAELCGVFESGHGTVAPRAHVYVGGQPVAVGPDGAPRTCGYCHTLAPAGALHCPNCGAAFGPAG